MLNENAKKWVAALRSGEYKQSVGYLHTDRGYCCLGVACVLTAQEGVGPTPELAPLALMSEENRRAEVYCYAGQKYVLPEKTRLWLGLQNSEGAMTDKDLISLAHCNDSLHKNFSEIADIIESEPEGLFVTPSI